MRAWFEAMLLVAAPLSAEQIFGPKRSSEPLVCADLPEIDAATTAKVNYWILGYWSALNTAKSGLVGDKATANGVIGEVKLYCTDHPSLDLPQATLDTFNVMREVKR